MATNSGRARGFSMSVDLSSVKQIQNVFDAIGENAFPRAVQFSLNGVAIDAVERFKAALPRVLNHPVPFTSRGIIADKANLDRASLDNLQSSIKVLPRQSAYLKYVFGDGPSTRLPGDVGLAQSSIYIPQFRNIAKAFRIKPINGKLPPGAVGKILKTARQKRERTRLPGMPRSRHARPNERTAFADARKQRDREDRSWGAYQTKINVGGREVEAIMGRPPRVRFWALSKRERNAARQRGGGRGKFWLTERRVVNVPPMANTDKPRVLFTKVDSTEHDPIAQAAWDTAAREAAATFPIRMGKELDKQLAHAIRKAR